MKKIFSIILFFTSSVLYGQTPSGYVLAKTGVVSRGSHPATVSFQWIATNPTSSDNHFFILWDAPPTVQIQSVLQGGHPVSILDSKIEIPNSNGKLIGPFAVGANASVTLEAGETLQAPGADGVEPTGEVFSLLPEARLTAKTSGAKLLSAGEGTPTTGGLLLSAVAGPNISNGGQPVNFFVNLSSSARIDLTLYTLTGERVFNLETQGNPGMNTLTWAVQNNAHEPVASGLYLFYLQVSGDGTTETKTGKVLILH